MKDSKLFIISIIIAILCYFLIQAKSKKDELEIQGQLIRVVTAETDIPAGTVISTQHIKPHTIPEKYYAPNTVLSDDWQRLIGLKAIKDIKKGDQLAYTDIPQLSQRLADDIPSGMRAFTISVDSNSSQAGQIQPGDKVDILAIFMNGSTMTSRTILQNIKILAVGGQRQDHDMSSSYNNLSLLVTPKECQHLALASQAGNLTVTLRNPKDEKSIVSNVTYQDELGKTTIKIPEK